MNPKQTSPTVERGTQIYEEQLRSLLEPAHNGEYLVINVETGEFEVDADHLVASTRAAARWPGTARYATRVGQRTVGRIGGRVVAEK